MDLDEARAFMRDNKRSVLSTRRRNGDPQMSPVLHVIDDEGRALVSSREAAYKVRNLRRDPRASLCVINDGFFGRWIQVDGTVEIVYLPEAMDLLIDYYRRAAGEHGDWDDYRAAMERERRVIVRIRIERAGPDRSG